jgi:hypothetical protein
VRGVLYDSLESLLFIANVDVSRYVLVSRYIYTTNNGRGGMGVGVGVGGGGGVGGGVVFSVSTP